MSRTENRNPKAENIDILSTEQILHLMNEEDASVIDDVKSAIPSIAKAVEEAVSVIVGGGRVFYVGAGTSGRLGVLDAAEMPSTFGVSPDLFHAIIAGGDEAIRKSVEGTEDDEIAGRSAASVITGKDMVICISASGKTPFILACLDTAKGKGAKCWLITCNNIEIPLELRTFNVDGIIKILTGPEIIAGSTRLKAGTATKLALNMFSTATMIKLGRVYKGLMVDVKPMSRKLIERAEGIIMEITGCNRGEASKYLKISGMRPKVAIVMKVKDVSKEKAGKMLRDAGNSLRGILG